MKCQWVQICAIDAAWKLTTHSWHISRPRDVTRFYCEKHMKELNIFKYEGWEKIESGSASAALSPEEEASHE